MVRCCVVAVVIVCFLCMCECGLFCCFCVLFYGLCLLCVLLQLSVFRLWTIARRCMFCLCALRVCGLFYVLVCNLCDLLCDVVCCVRVCLFVWKRVLGV